MMIRFRDTTPVYGVPCAPHRPWFKVVINTVLRFFQTSKRPARLFVMYSIFEGEKCVGYGLGRVTHV